MWKATTKMRIANYQKGLYVAMNGKEKALLGSAAANISIDSKSQKEWLLISSAEEGKGPKLHVDKRSGAFSLRVLNSQTIKLPLFGVEEVEAYSPRPGMVYVSKPKMDIPVISRSFVSKRASVRVPQRKEDVTTSFDDLKAAVAVVNAFKAAHKDLEISLNTDGSITVRLILEF